MPSVPWSALTSTPSSSRHLASRPYYDGTVPRPAAWDPATATAPATGPGLYPGWIQSYVVGHTHPEGSFDSEEDPSWGQSSPRSPFLSKPRRASDRSLAMSSPAAAGSADQLLLREPPYRSTESVTAPQGGRPSSGHHSRPLCRVLPNGAEAMLTHCSGTPLPHDYFRPCPTRTVFPVGMR